MRIERQKMRALRICDDDGQELDATFSVEEVEGQPTILLESGGGGRNRNYQLGLELLLARSRELGATLTDALLETRKTSQLPREQRRLPLPEGYPVPLGQLQEVRLLRKKLGALQQEAARAPGARGGGNSTKRIRLFLKTPDSVDLRDFEKVLAGHSTWASWALLANPEVYDVESASRTLETDSWRLPQGEVRVSCPRSRLTEVLVENLRA